MDKSKFNNEKELRKFGVSLGVIFSVIATIQLIMSKELYSIFYYSSFAIFIVSVVFPILIKPILILFSYIGLVIGWIMTRVILIFLFYFIFTPVGVILRLFGKKFLNINFSLITNSYWIERSEDGKKNYENQF